MQNVLSKSIVTDTTSLTSLGLIGVVPRSPRGKIHPITIEPVGCDLVLPVSGTIRLIIRYFVTTGFRL